MTELGYAERASNFNTTNATLFATTGAGGANPLVGALSVTVVGTGAPVMVEFYTPGTWHSSGVIVHVYFVVNGAVTSATSQYRLHASGQGEGGSTRRRMVLTNGVSYTFQVGLAGQVAGISTAQAQVTSGGASAGVMYLRVTD